MIYSFHNLLKRGVRIASRSKVNDSLITGSRIVDSILPVGRGQRQLILGDRYTGKTPINVNDLFSGTRESIESRRKAIKNPIILFTCFD